jgi:hypothetical protein
MSGLVLISGAGPVGMTMAIALKRRGVACASSTRRRRAPTSPRRSCCGRARWNCWTSRAASNASSRPVRRRWARASSPTASNWCACSLETARSAYRYALMIPQSETERLLEEGLEALGVRVERGTSSSRRSTTTARRRAVLRTPTAAPRPCAPTGSRLRRRPQHRAPRPGRRDLRGRHAAVRMGAGRPARSTATLPRDEITICWSHDGVMVFFPIAGARFRVIADIGADGRRRPADASRRSNRSRRWSTAAAHRACPSAIRSG